MLCLIRPSESWFNWCSSPWTEKQVYEQQGHLTLTMHTLFIQMTVATTALMNATQTLLFL